MFGIITLACFGAAGVAFMMYVLVNIHRDLRQARNKNRGLKSARSAERMERFNSNPVHDSAALKSAAPHRAFIETRHRTSAAGAGIALRRTFR